MRIACHVELCSRHFPPWGLHRGPPSAQRAHLICDLALNAARWRLECTPCLCLARSPEQMPCIDLYLDAVNDPLYLASSMRQLPCSTRTHHYANPGIAASIAVVETGPPVLAPEFVTCSISCSKVLGTPMPRCVSVSPTAWFTTT